MAEIKDIAVFGAGGFGREVACLINIINKETPRWNLIGFFDDGKEPGFLTEYGEVLGDTETLNAWDKPLDVVIAVGNPIFVKKIAESIHNPKIEFPNVIAPSVIFLDKANCHIGKGNLICSGCLISCNVTIGDFNTLNGFIPIGHDTTIGNYNVVMPSCNVSGGVVMNECNFMGVKSAILQYVKIGKNVRVGAGSIVMKNTKDNYLYVGIPATKVDM